MSTLFVIANSVFHAIAPTYKRQTESSLEPIFLLMSIYSIRLEAWNEPFFLVFSISYSFSMSFFSSDLSSLYALFFRSLWQFTDSFAPVSFVSSLFAPYTFDMSCLFFRFQYSQENHCWNTPLQVLEDLVSWPESTNHIVKESGSGAMRHFAQVLSWVTLDCIAVLLVGWSAFRDSQCI